MSMPKWPHSGHCTTRLTPAYWCEAECCSTAARSTGSGGVGGGDAVPRGGLVVHHVGVEARTGTPSPVWAR